MLYKVIVEEKDMINLKLVEEKTERRAKNVVLADNIFAKIISVKKQVRSEYEVKQV